MVGGTNTLSIDGKGVAFFKKNVTEIAEDT